MREQPHHEAKLKDTHDPSCALRAIHLSLPVFNSFFFLNDSTVVLVSLSLFLLLVSLQSGVSPKVSHKRTYKLRLLAMSSPP